MFRKMLSYLPFGEGGGELAGEVEGEVDGCFPWLQQEIVVKTLSIQHFEIKYVHAFWNAWVFEGEREYANDLCGSLRHGCKLSTKQKWKNVMIMRLNRWNSCNIHHVSNCGKKNIVFASDKYFGDHQNICWLQKNVLLPAIIKIM